jgi:hypothetical protein
MCFEGAMVIMVISLHCSVSENAEDCEAQWKIIGFNHALVSWSSRNSMQENPT